MVGRNFLGLFSVQEISQWHHGNFPFLFNPDLGSEPKLSRRSVLVCPWGSYMTFLSFYFLIHKRRVVGFRANVSKALRTSVLHHPTLNDFPIINLRQIVKQLFFLPPSTCERHAGNKAEHLIRACFFRDKKLDSAL